MKSTGITRKVDDLGRFVLPIEIRRSLDIKENDALEIFTDENHVVLKKYLPACTFCGEAENVVLFEDKRICRRCIDRLKAL